MAGEVVYEPPSNVEWARIATNPALDRALMEVGEIAKAMAEILSVDFTNTGRYLAGFRLTEDVELFAGHPRSVVTLSNVVPYAAVVELRHHVLSRTVDALHAI